MVDETSSGVGAGTPIPEGVYDLPPVDRNLPELLGLTLGSQQTYCVATSFPNSSLEFSKRAALAGVAFASLESLQGCEYNMPEVEASCKRYSCNGPLSCRTTISWGGCVKGLSAP
jgi:hypothetical protein